MSTSAGTSSLRPMWISTSPGWTTYVLTNGSFGSALLPKTVSSAIRASSARTSVSSASPSRPLSRLLSCARASSTWPEACSLRAASIVVFPVRVSLVARPAVGSRPPDGSAGAGADCVTGRSTGRAATGWVGTGAEAAGRTGCSSAASVKSLRTGLGCAASTAGLIAPRTTPASGFAATGWSGPAAPERTPGRARRYHQPPPAAAPTTTTRPKTTRGVREVLRP